MSKQVKKKQGNTVTTDDDYYPKYILESGGGNVTINITIKGDKNELRFFSGQPSQPSPKPPGGNG